VWGFLFFGPNGQEWNMHLDKSSLVCIPAHAAAVLVCLAMLVAAARVAQAQTTTVNGVDGAGNCGTVNLTNGQWTEIAGGSTILGGIGVAGPNLYGGVYQGQTLYQVDPTTCIYTSVGAGSISGGYQAFGAAGGMLYGLSPALTLPLYSVDPTTGATTYIGSTDLPPGGGQGLSSNCPVLYATSQSNSDATLFVINTTTGRSTGIGDTGVGTIDALVCANGILYGATLSGDLYTLNTTTGQATFVANTQTRLYGLAYLTFSTLTVTTVGDGTVTSTDGSINCPGTCSATYADGTQITLNATPAQNWAFSGWTGACSGVGPCTFTISQNAALTGVFLEPGNGIQFTSVTPCRLVDTRGPNGPFGGPSMQGNTIRSFTLPQDPNCTVPTSAIAYSLNVTVVPHVPLGYLTIWPTGEAQPVVSTLNSPDGRVKANAAIVPAGTSGAVSVYVTNTTDVILDIDGYFQAPGAGTYQFYPLTPCRVVDTRTGSNQPQGLGPPSFGAMETRPLPVLSSPCLHNLNPPPQAYSFNATVVPAPAGQQLGYLTLWPMGQDQPLVSTLNNPTATVVANAAIVPAGSNGEIEAFTFNTTDLIIDVNGYFGAPGSGGVSFYPAAPCRAYDSRANNGQPFSGERTIGIVSSPCAPPSNAIAYVFNATVVPSGSLGYLTLWPDSEPQPTVSTLNAYDGFVTSNLAIVPNANGSTDSYAGDGSTQLILDISGFFAP
jgi:Divergent InlB B-repeat domain